MRYAARNAPPPTEARILDAAERFVVDGTFHEATMQQIAAAAGTSRATVFGRFGSKLGVLEALSIRSPAARRWRASAPPSPSRTPSPPSTPSSPRRACVCWERQVRFRTLKAISILEPGAGRLIAEQRADQHDSLQGLVQRLGQAGALRPRLTESRALATLHVATSVETFVELRHHSELSLPAVEETVGVLSRSVLRTATNHEPECSVSPPPSSAASAPGVNQRL